MSGSDAVFSRPEDAPDSGNSRATVPAAHPPVVTLASLHGAAGHEIGPRVAERLGVEFLDRALPARVAKQAGIPEEAVTQVDESPRRGMNWYIANLGRISLPTAGTGAVERVDIDQRDIRSEIEAFLAHASARGFVVLGRGGAVVLGSVPAALHVLLVGPREARVRRVMALDGVDRNTAEQLVDDHDRARIGYVRSAYGVDGQDPRLYHLMIDTLALGTDFSVDLIVAASRARAATPTPQT